MPPIHDSTPLNRRSGLLRGLAAGSAALLAVQAHAHPGTHQGATDGAGMGMGMRPHGGPDMRRGWSERMTPEMQERMLERRTSHMLDAIQATPEQRSAVMAIAKAGFAAVAPLRAQMKASRDKGRELMFAATPDRAALEKLRQEQMKTRDAIGQRTLNSMLDALALLRPEQRAMLAKRMPYGMR